MANADDISMEGHGIVQGGGIVFDPPVNLPEGTEVHVQIAVITLAPAVDERMNDVEAPEHQLTSEQLTEWARKHPAPKEWWDATDNPFEP